MARILYAVMGNTHGHIMRTQSIIARMPQHEFHFIGGGRVIEAFGGKYPLLEVPVLRTVHHKQQVSISRTLWQIVRRILEIPRVRGQILKVVREWKPDVVIVDREFFTPIALLGQGVRVLGIDHSHVMKACEYPVPRDQWVSWGLAMLNDYLLFDFVRKNLIVSFFHPPKKKGTRDELFPTVLRRAALEVKPREGDYILVYQTSPTFWQLIEVLKKVKRPVIVYGFRKEYAVEGNLTFKPFDDKAILEDLAGCAYAVANGGHNLVCEALYYGKPLICFPIKMLFEQYINAWHIRSLGYGDFSTTREPELELFERFEKNLEQYRGAIRQGFREGTGEIVARVEEFIQGK